MNLTHTLRTVLLLSGLLGAVASTAIGQVNANAGASGSIRADFNGDGYRDLAIGAPYEDIDGIVDAGAVYVIYGSAAGLIAPATSGTTPKAQSWTQSSSGIPGVPEENDRFGASLAAGDFNNDGFTDLAIGIPGEGVFDLSTYSWVVNLGTVVIIHGTPQGLATAAANYPPPSAITPRGVFELRGSIFAALFCDCFHIQGFGEALAAGDFDGDGAIDLAIGAPSTDLNPNIPFREVRNAGLVAVLYGKQGTPMASSARTAFLVQEDIRSNATTTETSEAYDGFGSSLAAGDFDRNGRTDLVVGVHAEDFGDVAGAGMVHVFNGCGSNLNECARSTISQATTGIESSPEAGDFFGYSVATGDFNGDGFDDLAIGAPNENLGEKTNAGAVHVIPGSSNGLRLTEAQFWTQDAIFGTSPSVFEGSKSEAGDMFGFALATGDFNGDGRDDLAIGAPYEDVVSDRTGSLRTISDAGEVDVIYGSSFGLSRTIRTPQMWHQDMINVEGIAEAGDLFGSSLTAGNFGGAGTLTDLAVGITVEKVMLVRCGAVGVFYASTTNNGLSATGDQLWHQETSNVPGACEAGDLWGATLR